jgi:hypothetical protein
VFVSGVGSSSQPGTLIATTTADGSGAWSASDLDAPLADGTYAVTAEDVSGAGVVVGTASLGTVVVDSVGPVVDSVTLNRRAATVVITYGDARTGMDLASLSDLANYHLSAIPVTNRAGRARMVLPTSVSVTPGTSPSGEQTVTVAFRQPGRGLRTGLYLLKIDSGAKGAGVEDDAGNALAGRFSGQFPSGDGLPGGDFLAVLPTSHDKVLAVASVKSADLIIPARPTSSHASR